jgi:uncharacterized protein DUF4350
MSIDPGTPGTAVTERPSALPADEVSAPAPDLGERWRRARWPLAIALVVLLAALITALTLPGDRDDDRLSPGNPAPEGARAVAQILGDQGVEVRQVRSSAQVLAAAGVGTTVVVTGSDLLGPEQLNRLLESDERGARLVLVEPDEVVLSRLRPDVHAAGIDDERVLAPGCPDPGPAAAGNALAGGHLYATQSGAVCYGGSYVRVADVTVLGQSTLLTNEYLGRDGNAALALRALGAGPRLVWYTPDPLELSSNAQPPSISELLPRWVFWVGIQLLLAVLVAMLWRGNRLGKLVTEPLPVVVRAAETQEGRARLYRQASARGRAAETLRTAALRRLAARVAAPAGTRPEQVVALVAAATGRDATALRTTLLGPEPENDGALVTLADELDAVQRDLNEGDARR